MADMVIPPVTRQPATEGRAGSLPGRAVSHRARLDATPATESEAGLDIEIVRTVMERSSLQVKAFAINAGASRSQVSEALAGTPGRNLAFGWVLAQEREFVVDVLEEVEKRLGLTPRAKRAVKADLIAEVVRQIYLLGERAEERAS